MKKEFITAKFVPCGIYNLETLVHFGVLDLQTAVRVSGQELSTFDDSEKCDALVQRVLGRTERYGGREVIRDTKTGKFKSRENWKVAGFQLAYLINADHEHPTEYKLDEYAVTSELAARLVQVRGQVPEDRRASFGDNFSKIVEYNDALQRPILTEADGASPEFRETLYKFKIISPNNKSTRHYLKDAREGNSLNAMRAIGSYLGKKLSEGKTTAEVVRSGRLKKLLKQAAEARKSDNLYYSEKNHKELSLLADNAGVVFENYRRISQFRDQFRDQISALVTLYHTSRWDKQTQGYAHRMKQFLEG